MINSVYITKAINEAKQGVDDSVFGPLFNTDPNDITKKSVNSLAWAIYTMVLAETLKDIKDGIEK